MNEGVRCAPLCGSVQNVGVERTSGSIDTAGARSLSTIYVQYVLEYYIQSIHKCVVQKYGNKSLQYSSAFSVYWRKLCGKIVVVVEK
jgi:hypothetical protein